jgi:hypothetical protein
MRLTEVDIVKMGQVGTTSGRKSVSLENEGSHRTTMSTSCPDVTGAWLLTYGEMPSMQKSLQ